MNLMDILKDFSSRLPEEMADAKHYLMMAKAADKMGNKRLASGLFKMARDEYSHAEFIYENLHGAGIEIPEEVCNQWKQLEGDMCSIVHKS